MMMRSDYAPFERAIDADYIRHELVRAPGFIGEDQELVRINVSRVFPSKFGGLCVQYLLLVRQQDKTYRRVPLCGLLRTHGAAMPNWARREERVLCIADASLAIPLFPWDPKLSVLEDILGEQATVDPTRDVSDWVANGGATREVLSYRLARRCVLRYTAAVSDGDVDKIIVKIARRRRIAATINALEHLRHGGFALGAADALTVPGTLAVDPGHRFLVMEHVPGQAIHDLVGLAEFEDACAGAANTLAKLQRSVSTTGLPPYTVRDEISGLQQWAQLVGDPYPHLRRTIEDHIDELEIRMPSDRQVVCLHRDFYDKQVIYSPRRISLIDCDGLAAGDPALDYGNFLAHLVLRTLQHAEHGERIIKGMGAFRGTFPMPPARVAWWTSAALVRLAAIYSMRPRWRSLTPVLLEHAKVTRESKEVRV